MATAFVKVFYDFLDKTSRLTYEERGRLIEAMIVYAKEGVESECLIGNEQFLFPVFKTQIDSDNAYYAEVSAKRKAAGSKGGKQKVANATKLNHEKDIRNKIYEEDIDDTYVSSSSKAEDAVRKSVKSVFKDATDATLDTFAARVRNGMSADVIDFALDVTVRKGGRTVAYLDAVLDRWTGEGVTTLKDAQDSLKRFTGANKAKVATSYQQRAYTDADFSDEFFYDPTEDKAVSA